MKKLNKLKIKLEKIHRMLITVDDDFVIYNTFF